LYSSRVTKPARKGVEDARSELPALLDEAARGRATIITRRGRPIAALVPVTRQTGMQKPLCALAGSGKGLWGKHSGKTLRRLREEWSR
jgi:prevent-host-death family protein